MPRGAWQQWPRRWAVLFAPPPSLGLRQVSRYRRDDNYTACMYCIIFWASSRILERVPRYVWVTSGRSHTRLDLRFPGPTMQTHTAICVGAHVVRRCGSLGARSLQERCGAGPGTMPFRTAEPGPEHRSQLCTRFTTPGEFNHTKSSSTSVPKLEGKLAGPWQRNYASSFTHFQACLTET